MQHRNRAEFSRSENREGIESLIYSVRNQMAKNKSCFYSLILKFVFIVITLIQYLVTLLNKN